MKGFQVLDYGAHVWCLCRCVGQKLRPLDNNDNSDGERVYEERFMTQLMCQCDCV